MRVEWNGFGCNFAFLADVALKFVAFPFAPPTFEPSNLPTSELAARVAYLVDDNDELFSLTLRVMCVVHWACELRQTGRWEIDTNVPLEEFKQRSADVLRVLADVARDEILFEGRCRNIDCAKHPCTDSLYCDKHRCRGTTKQGVRCKNSSGCPHHRGANAERATPHVIEVKRYAVSSCLLRGCTQLPSDSVYCDEHRCRAATDRGLRCPYHRRWCPCHQMCRAAPISVVLQSLTSRPYLRKEVLRKLEVALGLDEGLQVLEARLQNDSSSHLYVLASWCYWKLVDLVLHTDHEERSSLSGVGDVCKVLLKRLDVLVPTVPFTIPLTCGLGASDARERRPTLVRLLRTPRSKGWEKCNKADASATWMEYASTFSPGEKVRWNGMERPLRHCFEKALECDATNANAWMQLGAALTSAETASVGGKQMNQRECLVEALEHNPTNCDAWMSLGAAMSETDAVAVSGRQMKKRDCFVRAVSCDAFRVDADHANQSAAEECLTTQRGLADDDLCADETDATMWARRSATMTAAENVNVNGISYSQRQCLVNALRLDPEHSVAWLCLGASMSPLEDALVNDAERVKPRFCFLEALGCATEDGSDRLQTAFKTLLRTDVVPPSLSSPVVVRCANLVRMEAGVRDAYGRTVQLSRLSLDGTTMLTVTETSSLGPVRITVHSALTGKTAEHSGTQLPHRLPSAAVLSGDGSAALFVYDECAVVYDCTRNVVVRQLDGFWGADTTVMLLFMADAAIAASGTTGEVCGWRWGGQQ